MSKAKELIEALNNLKVNVEEETDEAFTKIGDKYHKVLSTIKNHDQGEEIRKKIHHEIGHDVAKRFDAMATMPRHHRNDHIEKYPDLKKHADAIHKIIKSVVSKK